MMGVIPKCKYCGCNMIRWGWYFDPEHPVYYWYAFCCDLRSSHGEALCNRNELELNTFLVVLPEGTMEG
jgi:hypothetical protein